MSLTTALSGLMAAQTEISTTANNIANVATTGFRGSRVEFSDVFSNSPFSLQNTAVGTGVQVQRVATDLSQGNLMMTGNLTDLAIEGQGFFVLRSEGLANGAAGQAVFSRAGAFTVDSDGRVLNGAQQSLMCWPADAEGRALGGTLAQLQPLTIPSQSGTARATSQVTLGLALPSDDQMLGAQATVPPAAFAAADPSTWAARTPLTVFGPDGKPTEAEAYFQKQSGPDPATGESQWQMHLMLDGAELPASGGGVLTFDGNRALTGSGQLTFGSGTSALAVDVAGAALTAGPFTVTHLSQDGQSPARLTKLEIDEGGSVWATYGASERRALGTLALASFANTDGLRAVGKMGYEVTRASGAPILGTAGASGFGALRSGALERSNVELTEELVSLISAQRNYQASAKAMETSTSLMQTIMNIRS